jgi:Fe2+ or Zn2+ uptake regulation protein
MPRQPLTRQHIIQLLVERHTLTGPEILDALAERGQAVNKTSVYRAIDKMLADGLLCRHSFGSNTPSYELRDHHHDHAVCENCGKVQVVGCATEEPQIPGFAVEHHHATFFGRCAACQNKKRLE